MGYGHGSNGVVGDGGRGGDLRGDGGNEGDGGVEGYGSNGVVRDGGEEGENVRGRGYGNARTLEEGWRGGDARERRYGIKRAVGEEGKGADAGEQGYGSSGGLVDGRRRGGADVGGTTWGRSFVGGNTVGQSAEEGVQTRSGGNYERVPKTWGRSNVGEKTCTEGGAPFYRRDDCEGFPSSSVTRGEERETAIGRGRLASSDSEGSKKARISFGKAAAVNPRSVASRAMVASRGTGASREMSKGQQRKKRDGEKVGAVPVGDMLC